jgi:hypothetical protein
MKSETTARKAEQAREKKLPAGQERSGYIKPPPPEEDPIDEAAAESFPASDPPAFTGTTGSPSDKFDTKERAEKERPDPRPSP